MATETLADRVEKLRMVLAGIEGTVTFADECRIIRPALDQSATLAAEVRALEAIVMPCRVCGTVIPLNSEGICGRCFGASLTTHYTMTPDAPPSEEWPGILYLLWDALPENAEDAILPMLNTVSAEMLSDKAEIAVMKARAEAAEAMVGRLASALEYLRDIQNGPPLPSYTAAWDSAMAEAGLLIDENREEE